MFHKWWGYFSFVLLLWLNSRAKAVGIVLGFRSNIYNDIFLVFFVAWLPCKWRNIDDSVERVSAQANGILCIHCALQWAAYCWLDYCCYQSIVCGVFYILSDEYASYQIFLNNGLLYACAYAGGVSLLMCKNVRQNTNRLYFDKNESTTAVCNGLGWKPFRTGRRGHTHTPTYMESSTSISNSNCNYCKRARVHWVFAGY